MPNAKAATKTVQEWAEQHETSDMEVALILALARGRGQVLARDSLVDEALFSSLRDSAAGHHVPAGPSAPAAPPSGEE